MAEWIKMPFWVMDLGGPKEACIRWSPGPPYEGTVIRGKDMPGMPNNTTVSCAKMAEPIDLLFGLWTRGLKEAQVQSYLPVHGSCKHDFRCLSKIFTSFCKSFLMMRFSAFQHIVLSVRLHWISAMRKVRRATLECWLLLLCHVQSFSGM